jgi:hypothetical protein
MPDQNISLPDLRTEIPAAEPPAEEPVNRAARRGKARKHDPSEHRYLGSVGNARPAQGRRINPVRRSG